MGYASALAWLMLIIVVVAALVLFRTSAPLGVLPVLSDDREGGPHFADDSERKRSSRTSTFRFGISRLGVRSPPRSR
jgi:hypothetical protein